MTGKGSVGIVNKGKWKKDPFSKRYTCKETPDTKEITVLGEASIADIDFVYFSNSMPTLRSPHPGEPSKHHITTGLY